MPKVEQVWYVNEYCVDRAYGGPEEGGWWYDVGSFIETRSIWTTEDEALDEAYELRIAARDRKQRDGYFNRFSAAGSPDTEFFVEQGPGKDFPEERPYYE